MKLGERIYELRTLKKLSQADLAEMLDVSRQSISKWETDSSVPELDKLIKMCDIFEVSMDELTKGTEEPPRPAPITTTLSHSEITGYILLIAGLFAGILSIVNNHTLYLYTLCMPILICSAVCLKVRRNTAYICGWVIGNALCSYIAIRYGYWQADLAFVAVLYTVMYFYAKKTAVTVKKAGIMKTSAAFVANAGVFVLINFIMRSEGYINMLTGYAQQENFNLILHALIYSGGIVKYVICTIFLSISAYLFSVIVCHIHSKKGGNTLD